MGGRWFGYQVADDCPQVSEALRQLPQRSGSDGVQGRAHLCFQSGRQAMFSASRAGYHFLALRVRTDLVSMGPGLTTSALGGLVAA